jgi:hypothetical protein
MLQFKRGIVIDFDGALACCNKEQIICIIPCNFIDFNRMFAVINDLICASINDADCVVFIANSDMVSVRTPTYIDIFSCCLDSCSTFTS